LAIGRPLANIWALAFSGVVAQPAGEPSHQDARDDADAKGNGNKRQRGTVLAKPKPKVMGARPAYEVIDESMEEYGNRMGRYEQESYIALCDHEFWRDMHISLTATSPQSHLEFWFESEAANRQQKPSRSVVQFVCERKAKFLAEFEFLFVDGGAFETLWGPCSR
jgi:hypothetical protein